MNSIYRIFVKMTGELPHGKTDRVVHTEDADAKDVQARLRSLETQYPPGAYNYQAKQLNPLGL